MDERKLIQELQSKNLLAFDYVFINYYSGLCAFAHQYLQDRAIVEDIVQDLFISFWMDCSRLEIRSSLKSYLFTAVRNRCLDWQKHQNIVRKYRTKLLSEEEPSSVPQEEMILESDLRFVVQNALQQCSPRCREIFLLNRVDGLSNSQIAEKLQISQRTVELQISNALKIIRENMKEYMPLWMIAWLLGS